MKVVVFIDGRMLAECEYELPKDAKGRQIAVPARLDAESRSELTVVIIAPNGLRWVATAKLEPFLPL